MSFDTLEQHLVTLNQTPSNISLNNSIYLIIRSSMTAEMASYTIGKECESPYWSLTTRSIEAIDVNNEDRQYMARLAFQQDSFAMLELFDTLFIHCRNHSTI